MAPLKVAVIGGGPGGMFFCHSVHKQKQQTSNGRAVEVEVTCFEKEMTPGGIWKASESAPTPEESSGAKSSVVIYDELWTNSPCQGMEFYDYTWDEHFDSTDPIPAFLPRKDIAEHLQGRVTKNNPTFFEDYFRFGTQVTRVVENASSGFDVTVQDVKTGNTTLHVFDKLVWAAGDNGFINIPNHLRRMFQNAMTSGTTECESEILHSAETRRLKEIIEQKKSQGGARILLIGGSFSAEDLALQCIKWGADHIDITTRSGFGAAVWTSQWPANKVEVHSYYQVKEVEKNASGLFNVKVEEVEEEWPGGYAPTEDEDEMCTLENIDVAVFCTGYEHNLDMLDDGLRPVDGWLPALEFDDDPPFVLTEKNEAPTWLPKDWKMRTDHRVHEFSGDVPAGKGKMIRATNHPEMQRGIWFKNPNLMFIYEFEVGSPLLGLDVQAWLLAAYVTGTVEMPTVAELKEENQQELVDQMDEICIRYLMDEGYAKKLGKLPEGDGKFWPEEGKINDCVWFDVDWTDGEAYIYRQLAKIMQLGKYPGIPIGTYKELNETGKKLVDISLASGRARFDVHKAIEEDESREEWFTFRDHFKPCESLESLYTKIKARPLKKRWLDAVGKGCSVKDGDL